VLTNLLGNAVKFTHSGEAAIACSLAGETESHVLVKFVVSDTGIGISDETQQRLFQPFVQADGSTTRKYGGTGLGLAISRQLVELMEGNLTMESCPSVGSTFSFTLRLEKQVDCALPESLADLSGLRVLIVDDNPTNRRILVHQTSSWGMLPKEAERAAAGLVLLREALENAEPYHFALLDVHMPEMNGFELARSIRAEPGLAALPLVLMPSFGQKGEAETARRSAISHYACLEKPIRQQELYNCLVGFAQRGSPSKPVQTAETRPQPPQWHSTHWSWWPKTTW
jgi:Signal transduction histidine kinase